MIYYVIESRFIAVVGRDMKVLLGAINPETFTNTYGGQNAEAQKEKRQNKNNAKKAAKK